MSPDAAQVFRPEAVGYGIDPKPKSKPKSLTCEQVSYMRPVRFSFAPAEELTETRVRLKPPASYRKQRIGVVSNRNTLRRSSMRFIAACADFERLGGREEAPRRSLVRWQSQRGWRLSQPLALTS